MTNLVEAPTALLGRFEEKYLELPREVLVLVMRKGYLEAVGDHQALLEASPAYRQIFEQYEMVES